MPYWVRLKDEAIVHRTWTGRSTIPLSELREVLYHYHAAVGYVFFWEFIGANGQTIEVGLYTLGRSRLLRNLERSLPGFSLQRFRRLFEEGDVVDTLTVWKRGV